MDPSELFEEVYPALLGRCRAMTSDPEMAADAAQEAFARMVVKNVQGSREELRRWLFRTAGNALRDSLRRAKTRRLLMRRLPVRGREAAPPDEEVERRERKRAVRAALDALDDRARKLLMMSAAGFSQREIAQDLRVSTTSVSTLLARARRALGDKLQEQGYCHESYS
ncbi:MAG: sigma-70 family RNA polymerase sigma factor [Gammaproteobacteria bacterium]|nr:sigma-70 family RNA polymerase sigma factor [Gammaproteobacteria bacterium]MDE0649228.1 sigma-70 family RNA polymerase sigma factor [Gammaproteobacteria bacterium]